MNYDRVAKFYDALSQLYSTGQITASKRAQLKEIEPDSKVLYLGVGAGEDAVMACRAGARVTCVDTSSGMLERLKRRLTRRGLTAELICDSAFEHRRFGEYDACAANYFLNVFRDDEMERVLKHAISLVRSQGKIFIADVSLPKGNVLSRAFNLAYLKSAMATFWAMGLVPWHRNYEYRRYLRANGLETKSVEYFRFLGHGPVLFQNIVAVKP